MLIVNPAHALANVLIAVTLLPATPLSATEAPRVAPQPQRCEPPALGRDRLFLTCVLDEGAAPQHFHIKVHFTGSHDDTTASMELLVGDAPVACAAGSKTSTEGEDGDVTIDCQFTATGRPGTATVLRASAKWFHAQYVGLEVNGRRP